MTVSQGEAIRAPELTSEQDSFELLGRLRLARRLENRARVPELGDDALHGLAGQVVRALAPLTEASAPAMLLTLLVSFGAMVGRDAYVRVGHQRHYPVLFGVVVGASARARKGTGAAAVRPILDAADAAFMQERQIRGGIQSGEALIQAAASMDPAGEGGDHADQRVLLTEEEYARLLVVAGRQGSTLSPLMRSAWDSDILNARTKGHNLKASHAHIAVLGQVTITELNEVLRPVDVSNGYANRFVHVLSHRNSLKPEPGQLADAQIEDFGRRLREAVEFAHGCGEVRRSSGFQLAWEKLYRVVESQPTGGLVYDSLTSRASPQQLRLAMVYALLDQSSTLEEVHLRAAAALWEYAEASVAHIWGATLGDPHLDRLYAAVCAAGAEGLNRTQVSEVFSKNKARDELDALVSKLVDLGVATVSSRSSGGRPSSILTAVR